jgi:hypothetical protein
MLERRMAIEVTCTCGKQFRLPDDCAGKHGKCSQCGKTVFIPKPTDIPAADTLPEVMTFGRARKEKPAATKNLWTAILCLVVGVLIAGRYFANKSAAGSNGSGEANVADADATGGYVPGSPTFDALTEEPQWVYSEEQLTAPGSPYRESNGSQPAGGGHTLAEEYAAAYVLIHGTLPPKEPTDSQPNGTILDNTVRTSLSAAAYALKPLANAAFVSSSVGVNKSGWVVAVKLSGTGHTDVQLSLLKRLPHLQTLDMTQVDVDSITDQGLTSLSSLTQLAWLDLSGLKISEQAVAYLNGLKNLRHLDLHKTRLTDRGIASIRNLTSLVYLDVRNTKLTDAGVSQVSGLVNLRTLLLYDGNAITPRNVYRNLAPLKNLASFEYVLPHQHTLWPDSFGVSIYSGLMADVNEPLSYEPACGPMERDWKNVLAKWERRYQLLSQSNLPLNWNELKRKREEIAKESAPAPNYQPAMYEEKARALPDHLLSEIQAPAADVLDVIQGMNFYYLPFDVCPCTDNDLARVAEFENLEVLDLTGSTITGRGLQHLSVLKQLKYLNLTGTNVKKTDLLVLKSFPRITDVVVNDCRLSAADVQELGDVLPRVAFVAKNSGSKTTSGSNDSDPIDKALKGAEFGSTNDSQELGGHSSSGLK